MDMMEVLEVIYFVWLMYEKKFTQDAFLSFTLTP